MKIKKQLIKRDIAGDTILVPVGKTIYDSNGLYVLNEVASFLWDCLQQAKNEDELVSKVLEEYDVSYEEAKQDVHQFLSRLKEMNILD